MQGKYFFLSYNLLLPLIRARPKVLVMGVACRAAFRRFFLRGRGCGFRGFPELIRKKGRGYQVLLYYFFFLVVLPLSLGLQFLSPRGGAWIWVPLIICSEEPLFFLVVGRECYYYYYFFLKPYFTYIPPEEVYFQI